VANCPELRESFHDMKRFALHNRAGIEQAPLQAYSSALVFTPVRSLVRNHFCGKMPRWIRRSANLEMNWSTTLQILEGHSGEVEFVTFSPDGKQLASCSSDHTIRIWDTATGATLQILKGHSREVEVVVFSPDGKQLASCSYDKTIRIWDVATGTTLQILEDSLSALSGWIHDISFSPDGRQLASFSHDKKVRI
jgi:WD40 repeat protein